MTVIVIAICLLVIGYITLAAIGAFRRCISTAFTWIGISLMSAMVFYGLSYVLQDFLPRLYELAMPASVFAAATTLAIGFSKVLGRS